VDGAPIHRPALILFGDRVGRDELAISHGPVPLWQGEGLEQVEVAAQRASIALLI
jgi:hypothetical protein